MDHRLLEIIACPVCNGKLYYSQDKQELICKLDSLGATDDTDHFVNVV